MPDGGKATPISPGIIARLTQAGRYVINGVRPDTWFGPMQPIAPMAPPDVAGRRFDYPTGYNLSYTPRGNDDSAVSFDDLRALADGCDILRSVIETRKDQMEALDWNIRLKPDADSKRKTPTDDQNGRIDAITQFLQYPDKRNNWQQWLRQWLEDMFVIDAACFYKRPDRKGDLWGLEPVDGGTIKILLGDDGRIPLPPNPAYQQILKGVPASDYTDGTADVEQYTSNELLYLMRNPRTHKVYGYSHVEQVLLTVNTLIRRQLFQLEYYKEGSQPDAFLGLPKEWNQQQVVDFQKHFDGMMSGNLGLRRRLRFMPGDFKYQATKEPSLKDEYDEWLARVICFVFSIAPTPFIKANNRATAQSSHDAALEEGLAPLQKYVAHSLNRIIAVDFNSPDLEFTWVDDREQDPLVQMQVDTGYVKAGIRAINEVRETIGDDPVGNPAYDVPMPLTPTGYVAIKSPEEQDAASQAQQDAKTAALQAHASAMGHNGGPELDDEHQNGHEPAAPADEEDKPANTKDADKLADGTLKKKRRNPYLHMTVRRR